MFDIKKVIQINAPIERVYSALISSDEIPQYFPLKKVESTWREGEEVLYYGVVGEQPFIDYGVIEKLNSPNLYQYSYWSDNHGTERLPENHISISYQLKENQGGTELVLNQSNIQSRELYQVMEEQVWDYLLGSLKQYVEIK